MGDNDDEPERNEQLLNNWFGQGPVTQNPHVSKIIVI